MSMMQWTVEPLPGRDEAELVRISGFITEEADFQPLAALPGKEALCLDLAGVEQINSCGVREWIHFVRLVTKSQRPLELCRCSPAIVRQLNTISNFGGGGTVRSVMLPYYCAACGREEHRLLDLPTTAAPPPIEEVIPCSACQGAMEFDDLPSSYMAFSGRG
jgi:ABC-type transporter Mla MlaB component